MSAIGTTRARAWLRAVLAGPLALVAALTTMAGSALWLPAGKAQINDLVLPVILFPLVWTLFFLYACLDPRLLRAYALMSLCVLASGALIAWHVIH